MFEDVPTRYPSTVSAIPDELLTNTDTLRLIHSIHVAHNQPNTQKMLWYILPKILLWQSSLTRPWQVLSKVLSEAHHFENIVCIVYRWLDQESFSKFSISLGRGNDSISKSLDGTTETHFQILRNCVAQSVSPWQHLKHKQSYCKPLLIIYLIISNFQIRLQHKACFFMSITLAGSLYM